MRRLLGFILQLALFVALAVWLADRPGTARIVWHGYIIETSAALLGLGALAFAYILYLLFRFWHLVRNGPELWRLGRALKKTRQGHEYLTKGMVAVAGGDAIEAGRLAVGARKLLGTTPAVGLLQAQAAQLAGDNAAAREIFRALAEEPDSAVLGYRGLIMDARRAGDWQEVDRLAQQMELSKPGTPWLNLVHFEIAAHRQDWDGAAKALAHGTGLRLIEPKRLKRYRAAVLIAASREETRRSAHDKALSAAEAAVKQAPDWLPAILTLAQCQLGAGHRRAAQRTIEKNWESMPHPRMAEIYRAEQDDPVDGYRRIEKLCRASEDAPQSRLALAEAALAADIWGEARRHLMALISRDQAGQAAFRMMARLERREGGDERAALQWMTKAAEAHADPTWLCGACGGAQEDWQPSCPHCASFATFDWQSPGVGRDADSLTLPAADWIG